MSRRIASAEREVARLERAYPAAKAEWELAEAEWAVRLPGAGNVIDEARDAFDTLCTDRWLVRERLANLLVAHDDAAGSETVGRADRVERKSA